MPLLIICICEASVGLFSGCHMSMGEPVLTLSPSPCAFVIMLSHLSRSLARRQVNVALSSCHRGVEFMSRGSDVRRRWMSFGKPRNCERERSARTLRQQHVLSHASKHVISQTTIKIISSWTSEMLSLLKLLTEAYLKLICVRRLTAGLLAPAVRP